GTIVHWPKGIAARGELRQQFCHVIDVAPTVLEAAGLPAPASVHGVTQEPMHGVSMRYTFDAPTAPEQHETQYFEMVCNRGIYHKGWSAVTKHRTPWQFGGQQLPLDQDVWELYDGRRDFTQAHNLAAEQPEKLAELQRLFLIQAARFNVLPLDDRLIERLEPEGAGRPRLVTGTSQRLYPGMRSLSEDNVLNIKNKSHSITAEVVIPDDGASGVIINQGGITGGWALYMKDEHLAYCYNYVGLVHTTVTSEAPIPPGEHQLRLEFAYDGGGAGKGGLATLYLDGKATGSTRVERTHLSSFNLDETNDVGRDTGAPVTDDYPAVDNAFTGHLKWVQIDLGQDSQDHLVDPEHLAHVAMTRQ
ncbi:MAG: arylsulfatase, partial [Chloroflexi bacterium]|nr:arylsulfatase [Chloroflexota bacterium]